MKRYRTNDEWKELISRQETSDLNIAAFSKKEGIHPNLFYKKRRDFGVPDRPDHSFTEIKSAGKPWAINKETLIKIGSIEIYPANRLDPRELLVLMQTSMEATSANIQ
jgi:hypothetical protein